MTDPHNLSPAEQGFARMMTRLREIVDRHRGDPYRDTLGPPMVNAKQILDLGDPHGLWSTSFDNATTDPTTVYVSIGNSDDKLTQSRWACYVDDIRDEVRRHADQIHGEWYSAPDAIHQNACFCAAVPAHGIPVMRAMLTQLRDAYGQDSLAWAVAPETEFI